MKKITLVLFCFLTLIGWSQNPDYRYHDLEDLGPNIEWAISIECTHHFSPLRVIELNLKQNYKLKVGNIYKIDLGLGEGTRYYRVKYTDDIPYERGIDIYTPIDFGAPITDLCNSLSWKYIRPILLGSTLQEAQNNFCSNLTVNNTREMVNIKIAKSLASGDVCFMDFGKGANYYLIDGASVESGDADYEVDSTDSNSLFSIVAFNCQKPDLQAVAVTPSTYEELYRGSIKSATFTIRNIGTNIQSATTTLTFYLSKSSNYTDGSDDTQLLTATQWVTPSNANNSYTASVVYTVPNTISNGQYYLTMRITNTEDFNGYNNIVSSPYKIVIKDGTSPTNPNPNPTGKPDLVIDRNNTIVFSNCFDCPAALSDLGNRRHTISNQSGSINLQAITIKNTGNAASTPTNLQFYLSTDGIIDTADLKSTAGSITINAINPGASITVSKTIFSSDFGNIGTTFTGNRNILISVDDSKTNAESNENNNVTAIPVTFYNPFGKIVQSKLEAEEVKQPYSINVYNFQGQKVLTKEVSSEEEENKSLDSLKSGIYMIKSKNETRKVIK
ncbi:CARDB domain-containing protein [Flavobacterium flavigenum]|uniref:CARDB domain-containing protein n=1 Tax=Flavobacterium flavigenum TaxID=3003258 RepID=UPI0022AC645E|nr:CARDB domain-containing protein [Flavobacterium flavigenum]